MTGNIHEPGSITVGTPRPEGQLMRRVRGDYRKLPEMRLTIEQAMRLWDVDRDTCWDVMHTLIEAHVLRQDRYGRYTTARGGAAQG